MELRRARVFGARKSLLNRSAPILAIALVPFVLGACIGSISGNGTAPKATTKAAGSTATKLDTELFNGGAQALNRGQFKAALTDYQAIVSIFPKNTTDVYLAEFDIGVTDVNLNDIPAAVTAFQKSLAIKPNYSFALNDLAVIESASDPNLAISLYQRLLKTNPANPASVYTLLGNLLVKVGKTTEGRSDLAIADGLNNTKALSGGTGGTTPTTTVKSKTKK